MSSSKSSMWIKLIWRSEEAHSRSRPALGEFIFRLTVDPQRYVAIIGLEGYQRPLNQTIVSQHGRSSQWRCSFVDGFPLMKSSGTCVMLRVSEPWQSVARYSGPLNRDLLLSTSHSFLPSIPSSFHSPTLLHLTQLSNPLSHFLSFFLLLLLLLLPSSFCSFVPLWHIPQARRAQGETEQERMAREVKQKEESEGGKEGAERRAQVIFYLIVEEKRMGRVSQQGDQRQTQGDRDGEAEMQRRGTTD